VKQWEEWMMKEKIKVSLVQFAPTWLKPEVNAKRLADFTEDEARKGSELIVFPELSNVGYITPVRAGLPPSYSADVSAAEFAAMYVKASERVPGPTSELLEETARKHGVHVVVGLSRLHPVIPAVIFNSAVLIGPSGLIGIYDKVHMPSNEKLFFHPGGSFKVFKTDLGSIGISICYDGRFPEIGRILALKGAEIICSIWNIATVENTTFPGTLKYRASTRAMENSCYYLACDRAGVEGDVTFFGESTIAKPNGEIVACLDSDEEGVIRAELYNEEIIKVRSYGLTVFQDRRPALYGPIAEPLPFAAEPPTESRAAQPETEGLE
jgi:predicted amidohydrolase